MCARGATLALLAVVSCCLGGAAWGADILMTFQGDPVIPPGSYEPAVELSRGDSHTYYFNTAVVNGSQFDFEIVLEVLRGDADLVVEGPISDASGQFPATPTLQRFSLHHTGSEIVFLPREHLEDAGRGLYSATVHGFDEVSEYRITLEEAYTSRRPPLEEQAVLEAVWEKCCHSQNACYELEFAVRASGYLGPDEELDNFCHQRDQTCDSEGHITSLRLSGENMECEMPEELGNLKHLVRLEMEDNFLFGSVERVFEVFNDTALESIRVQQNDLSSDLPCFPSDGKLAQSLTYLDISFNRIEGEFPPCIIPPNMQIFTVEGNYLTGEFPQSLPPHPQLTHFDMSWQEEAEGKRVVGQLPDFGPWSSLEFLGLSDNALTGTLPSLPPTIRNLQLDENMLNTTLPSSLAQYENLAALNMERNMINGQLPAELSAKMQVINLGDNDITGSIPPSWSSLTELREIRVHDNFITGQLPGWLGSLPYLWALDLEDNQITGTLEPFAAALSEAATNALIHFDISDNQFEGPIPGGLARMAMFTQPERLSRGSAPEPRFDASANLLSGEFPETLALAAFRQPDVFFSLDENTVACPSTCLNLVGNVQPGGRNDREGRVLSTTCMQAERSMTLMEDQMRLCGDGFGENSGGVEAVVEDEEEIEPPSSPSPVLVPVANEAPDSLNSREVVPSNQGSSSLDGGVSVSHDLATGTTKPLPEDGAPPSATPAPPSSGMNTAILAIVVVAAIVLSVLIIVGAFFAVRSYRRKAGKAYENYSGDGNAAASYEVTVPPTHAAVVDLESQGAGGEMEMAASMQSSESPTKPITSGPPSMPPTM